MNKNYKETIKLAIPVVIGQVSQLLMNITDSVIVGRLGEVALSAAAFANSCFIFVVILGLGALNALPSVVSEARGANNQEAIRENLKAALWSGLFWGILTGVLVYAFALFMPYMGQPKSDVLQAQPFLIILAISVPFMCVFTGIKGFFDGMEKTSIGMNLSIIGLLLNIFLNIALVFGKFGFPNWGLLGSAWATLFSRIFICVLAFIVLIYNDLSKNIFSVRFPIKTYFRDVIQLGTPMGMQLFFEVAAFSGAGIMIGWLQGQEAIEGRAAHQIALNTIAITFMVMLGISVAGSVRVGEAFGRKDKKAIYEAGKTALILGYAFSIFSAILLILSKDYFTMIYGIENVRVAEIVARLTIISAFFQIFDSGQCVGAGLLRGLQDVKIPTIITFVAYWLIWLPLAYLMGFTFHMGVDGIWYADIIALGFAAVFLNWRFFKLVKMLNC